MQLFYNNKVLYRFLVFSLFAFVSICIFFPFLISIAVAGIFAQVLNPVVLWLQKTKIKKLSMPRRKKCAAFVMLVMLAFVSLPFGIIGKQIYGEAVEFSNTEVAKQRLVLKFSKYMGGFESEISNYIKKLGLTRQLTVEDVSSGIATKTANLVFDVGAKIVASLPALLINFLIFCAALFYFLAESEKLDLFFRETVWFSKREMQMVRDSFKVSSHASVVSTILTGLIHGCIVAIGAELVGVGDFYVVLVLTFFLSFIPVIGASLIALGLCAPALLAQNYTGALVMLGIALFASAVDNVIRPWFLIHGNNQVHPLISLLSVLGGIALFGMAGLFIGPVLVQVTFDVLPKLVSFREDRSDSLPKFPSDSFELTRAREVTMDDFNY